MAEDTTEVTDVNSADADAEIAAAMAAEEKQTPSEDSSSEDITTAPGAETKPADKTEQSEETAEADKPKEGEEAEEESAEETAEADGDKPAPKSAEARKEQLNGEIRTLVAQKNKLRSEVAAKNGEAYTAKTAEELISDGLDPAEARVQALEERQELNEFNTRVADLNSNLDIESLQVMADFPMFNPGTEADPNPEYDEGLSELARATFKEVANVQVDKNTGLIISAQAMPYNIYKSFAEAYSLGTQKGTVKGQAAADKNEAAADTTTSAAPKPAKVDPFLAGLKS